MQVSVITWCKILFFFSKKIDWKLFWYFYIYFHALCSLLHAIKIWVLVIIYSIRYFDFQKFSSREFSIILSKQGFSENFSPYFYESFGNIDKKNIISYQSLRSSSLLYCTVNDVLIEKTNWLQFWVEVYSWWYCLCGWCVCVRALGTAYSLCLSLSKKLNFPKKSTSFWKNHPSRQRFDRFP